MTRELAPQVLAGLARRCGDFAAAEDAVQEALLAALRQWPVHGVPDDPRAWLHTVAARRLVDAVRSEAARAAREDRTAGYPTPGPASDTDDSLTLMLLCCHPVLPRLSQVALTLRAVGGLTTAQIAHGLLVPEATAAQRISRAKTRLRTVPDPFGRPPVEQLPARVAAVAHVLYLVFTEGHTATTGGKLRDVGLAGEAIRLARMLDAQLPATPEVAGLLALMLLTEARAPARLGPAGELVPLAEQDRSRWDAHMIAEGTALIDRTLPTGPVGPYQLQAAVAAVHGQARVAADTDWPQIAELYALLEGVAPGPVVTLNRAVAVGEADGPAAGLAVLTPLLTDRAARWLHRVPAVHAHLLVRLNDGELARAEFTRAAGLATSIPEQRYLLARAAALDPSR